MPELIYRAMTRLHDLYCTRLRVRFIEVVFWSSLTVAWVLALRSL